jgi:hypothetical protein
MPPAKSLRGPAAASRGAWIAARSRVFWITAVSVVAGLSFAASPAAAWTPATQLAIAREAARLAPPDLARQIARRARAYEAGVQEPFGDADPARHRKDEDGSGSLDRALYAEVDGAIRAIREHRPFDEVVRRLGAASHFMADANNPLATSAADAEAGRYSADFLRYAESAEPRFPLVLYGLPARGGERSVAGLLAETLRRGRRLYPLVGREYRRIGFGSGVASFDDRSTAFAVASLAFGHAVTDVATVLRYIWLQAGGGDDRSQLAGDGSRVLLLPRARQAP